MKLSFFKWENLYEASPHILTSRKYQDNIRNFQNMYFMINFFIFSVLWLFLNLRNGYDGIFHLKHDGDQIIYLSRARTSWDQAKLGTKYIQNYDAVDGTYSNFEKYVFEIPSYFLSQVIDFKTYLLLIILLTFTLFLFTLWRFTSILSSNYFERQVIAVFFMYAPEIQYLITFRETRESIITKWPFPALHYILILETIIILWNVGKQRLTFRSITTLFGLLIVGMNCYFFTWQIQILTVLFACLAFARSRKWLQLKQMAWLFSIYCSFSILKFKSIFFENKEDSTLYYYSIERIFSRDVIFPKTILILVIVISILIVIKETSYVALLAFVTISTFVLFNQQVLTGMTVQPGHILWYWAFPMLGMGLGKIILSCLWHRKEKPLFLKTLIVLALPISLGSITLVETTKAPSSFTSDSKSLDSINNQVIFSDGNYLENIILIETNNRFYWHDISKLYLNNDEATFKVMVSYLIWESLEIEDDFLLSASKKLCLTADSTSCYLARSLNEASLNVWRRNMGLKVREEKKRSDEYSDIKLKVVSELKHSSPKQYLSNQLMDSNVGAFVLSSSPSLQQVLFMRNYCKIREINPVIWLCYP